MKTRAQTLQHYLPYHMIFDTSGKRARHQQHKTDRWNDKAVMPSSGDLTESKIQL